MKVQASEYPGVSLLVEDAADSSLLQVEQIRSLIKRKVDLLIISANESEPVTPIAIGAYRAGIPTILVDRKISRTNIRLISVVTITRSVARPAFS